MNESKHKVDRKWLERVLVVGLLDVICIGAAFFLALWMRYEFSYDAIPKEFLYFYAKSIPFWIVICIFVFSRFRLYNSIWIFVGFDELFRVILAYGVLLILGGIFIFAFHVNMPIVYYVVGFLLSFFCHGGTALFLSHPAPPSSWYR